MRRHATPRRPACRLPFGATLILPSKVCPPLSDAIEDAVICFSPFSLLFHALSMPPFRLIFAFRHTAAISPTIYASHAGYAEDIARSDIRRLSYFHYADGVFHYAADYQLPRRPPGFRRHILFADFAPIWRLFRCHFADGSHCFQQRCRRLI